MRRVAALLLASLTPAAAAAVELDFGKLFFEQHWSSSEADGLGPLFNERSCAACHKGGGPARFVAGEDGTLAIAGAVVRLGDTSGHPDPRYGVQIQTQGNAGNAAEGVVDVRLTPAADGLSTVRIELSLRGGALAPGVTATLRVAPGVRTAAGIERVDAEALALLADPGDRDGDGVSGRVRQVVDADGRAVIGRFGWRAGQTSLTDQVASAFALDMGLSSPQRPMPHGDCTASQITCITVPAPGRVEYGGHEVSADIVRMVATFVETLETPSAAEAGHGAALFGETGCAACHRPEVPATGGGSVTLYSDLMLHDMGPGLSDGTGEADVSPTEWRTPPLRGLSKDLSATRRFLHDGRAATVEEAIRWHGGEAQSSVSRFNALDPGERQRLIDFVESL